MRVQAGECEGGRGEKDTKSFWKACAGYHRAAPSLIRLPLTRDEEC